MAYGAGVDAIVESTGMSREDVEALIAAEEARYPSIAAYYVKLGEHLKKNRKPRGQAFRHPDDPTYVCNGGYAYFSTPDGKKYRFTEGPVPKFMLRRNAPTTSFSPTESRNYPVQGFGAEVMKAAMALAVVSLYRAYPDDDPVCLTNTVHDALYVDCKPEYASEAADRIHACMLEASTYIEYLFGWEQPVHVPAEIHAGKSWADEGHAPISDHLVAVYRKSLRYAMMNGYTPSISQ